jgi:hypothetical protein
LAVSAKPVRYLAPDGDHIQTVSSAVGIAAPNLQAIRMMHDLRRDVDEFCKIKGFAGFNVDNSGYFVKGICLRKSG